MNNTATQSRRHLTLDKLSTQDIRARVYLLADSNPSLIVARLEEADAAIARAEKALEDAKAWRILELQHVSECLADWSNHELRKAGLRRLS